MNILNSTQFPKTLEFRESFTHPSDKCLIGIDADALNLAHLKPIEIKETPKSFMTGQLWAKILISFQIL